MKTIHYLAGIVALACACTDPPPASGTPQQTAITQNANATPDNNGLASRVPDAEGPVGTVLVAPLPTVPQPNPPCTSCPITGPIVPTH